MTSLLIALLASAAPDWQQITRLVEAQKADEALRAVEWRLSAAQQSGDEEEWARALIRAAELRAAAQGSDVALRWVRDQRWPSSSVRRVELELFIASALLADSRAEAERAFAALWARRGELGTTPAVSLGEFLQRGTYPPGIRDTLRDAVTYAFVELLSNDQAWRPEHRNGLSALDVGALVRDAPAVDPADPAVHPLIRISVLLSDLQAWHLAAGRREAALEAMLERARRLRRHATSHGAHERIVSAVEARLKTFRDVPWYSEGKAEVAGWLEAAGDRARALDVARQCSAAYPSSRAGELCAARAKEIQAPELILQAMRADGPRRPSIELVHRNLRSVSFRAYALDLDGWIARWNGSGLPEGQFADEVRAKSPVASWTVALPATADFARHATFITPPLDRPGLYFITASNGDAAAGKPQGIALLVTDLVVVTSGQEDSPVIRVLDGNSGNPVRGATVELYGRRGFVDRRTTDATGAARWQGDPGFGEYLAVARFGRSRAISGPIDFVRRSPPPPSPPPTRLYTDRREYQPLQTIRWKVVAAPGTDVTVDLSDPQSQRVDSVTARTSSFGSAAGEFLVPPAAARGPWAVQTAGASAVVNVDPDFRPPSFEATFRAPAAPPGLNHPVSLSGDARYDSGLPVAFGQVRWRVVREDTLPQMTNAWEPPRRDVVAAGTSALAPDGSFSVEFTIAGDERTWPSWEWQYRVTAEVTDAAGETQTAERVLRVGTPAVTAAFGELGFFREGQPVSFTIRRTDLDGTRRPGSARAWITRLAGPQKTPAPADESPPALPELPPNATPTPGDLAHPRWASSQVLPGGALVRWKESQEVVSRELIHAEDGKATLEVAPLAPGAYRLHYETRDPSGEVFRAHREFVVAGPSTRLNVPLGVWAEAGNGGAGATRLFVTSGFAGQTAFLEIRRPGHVEERVLRLGVEPAFLELPAIGGDEEVSIRLFAVRDHQLMGYSRTIRRPSERRLEVRLADVPRSSRPARAAGSASR